MRSQTSNEESSATDCTSSSQCGTCAILSFENVSMECVRGQCLCPCAFYHLAVDPGTI